METFSKMLPIITASLKVHVRDCTEVLEKKEHKKPEYRGMRLIQKTIAMIDKYGSKSTNSSNAII